MDFSMKLFTMLSLLLIVSMATADMGDPLAVDAQFGSKCDQEFCTKGCGKFKLFGCCPQGGGYCECVKDSTFCPVWVTVEINGAEGMAAKE